MTKPAIRTELAKRQDQVLNRAVEKYGAAGLLAGGHPDYDPIDYLINEIVGIPRYTDMILARLIESGADINNWDEWAEQLRVLRTESLGWAETLLSMQDYLSGKGMVLGSKEFE